MTTTSTTRKLNPAQQDAIDLMAAFHKTIDVLSNGYYLDGKRLNANTFDALKARGLIRKVADSRPFMPASYTLTEAGAAASVQQRQTVSDLAFAADSISSIARRNTATSTADRIITLANEREDLLRRYPDLTTSEHERLNTVDRELDGYDYHEVKAACDAAKVAATKVAPVTITYTIRSIASAFTLANDVDATAVTDLLRGLKRPEYWHVVRPDCPAWRQSGDDWLTAEALKAQQQTTEVA